MNDIPMPLPRVAAFEKFGFGLFIHFGLYSQRECGEKVMFFDKMPNDEYEKLMNTFTVENFSGRTFARLAKAAGMKYVCLTSRHHDGFSLYDTCGLNCYDAPHSAAKRDLIADFVEGCNTEGIVPFLYHTTLDWHTPDFQNDFPAYLDYLFASVELLCKNYGKIGGFWFDGNWSKKNADWRETEFYRMIRSYQPEAILINNTGIGQRGAVGNTELDAVTYENGRPTPLDQHGFTKYLAGEMCETMNDYWGYAADDLNYKSSATLIESLCACRKVGANYLLNIGPRGDGSVAPEQEMLIRTIGRWRTASGAPLYDVKPCGITSEDNRSFGLRDSNGTVYLYVYGLCRADADGKNGVTHNGVRVFRGISDKVNSVRWLDNGESLSFTQNGDELSVLCTGYSYGKSLVVRVAEIKSF